MNPAKVFFKGLFKENPVFVIVLGMCPTLATTTSLEKAIGMGLATTFVLVFSNLIISLIKKMVPDEVRIPIFIVVIATFVTLVKLIMAAYFPELKAALGIFLPLIVVNCIILGRAEALGETPANTVNAANQDYWQRAMLSYMGRVMYSYDNKYMISAAVRSDASSVLAPGHQWHTYPAVSAGWNIANEQFMSSVNWVNSLKLRVGFGQTSNQAINPYQTLGLLGTVNYNFADRDVTGFNIATLPNSELGWEFSSTWNFGVDFGLFNNRLTGTIEYYMQKTKNVLQSVNLPTTSGVGSYTANIGKTQNKGIELTLNGVIIDNLNGWTWEAGVNLYANRNKLTELASGMDRNVDNRWFVGYPINSIYDFEAIGLWQEGDPYMKELEPNATPGSIRVKYNGGYEPKGPNGETNENTIRAINEDQDRQIMSMEPNFLGGFNTRVSWRGLDLSIVGMFQSGGILISTLYQANGYLNMLNGRRGQVDIDYWRPDNTGARFPGPWSGNRSDSPSYLNSLGYFDASYLKISTITLGYNLPKKWMDRAGIDGIRVYATAQNPFVFFSEYHKMSGLDPEPNTNMNGDLASGRDGRLSRFLVVGTNTPNTRNFLFGVNLTF